MQLCLTYRERLRLANELAKLRIEEEKLKSINGQKQQQADNPLLAVLKEIEEME
ncbi:hypothetical protein [Bacillus cereus]|uniref:hypothetical protein n=1 Tax=Bacillus cereus TaxID=1396 RepID=UPI0015D51395|nr:hypothetical protein [Bacillus cereus]